MKKVDDIFDNVIWTEKYNFGVIIPKANLFLKEFLTQINFLSLQLLKGQKTIFKKTLYAILYTDEVEEYSTSITKLLNWIEKNGFVVDGDLFIEDPSTYMFSKKYNPFVKIFKISIKNS